VDRCPDEEQDVLITSDYDRSHQTKFQSTQITTGPTMPCSRATSIRQSSVFIKDPATACRFRGNQDPLDRLILSLSPFRSTYKEPNISGLVASNLRTANGALSFPNHAGRLGTTTLPIRIIQTQTSPSGAANCKQDPEKADPMTPRSMQVKEFPPRSRTCRFQPENLNEAHYSFVMGRATGFSPGELETGIPANRLAICESGYVSQDLHKESEGTTTPSTPKPT